MIARWITHASTGLGLIGDVPRSPTFGHGLAGERARRRVVPNKPLERTGVNHRGNFSRWWADSAPSR